MPNSRAFIVNLCVMAIVAETFIAGCGSATSAPATRSAVDSEWPKPDETPKNSSPTSAPRLDGGTIHFTSRIDGSGVDFVHVSGNSAEKPFPAANGSGVATFDYDLDGLCDLYFATGNSFPLNGPGAMANKVYQSLGSWRFRDRTAETGLGHRGYSAGLAVGDYDADGFPDVYVACYGSDVFYRNQGDGTFADVSIASGTDDDRWGTSAAFLDYDNDGLLDLYVGNYARWTPETNPYCGDRQHGRRMFCGPTMVPPEDHVLLHNEGDGAFTDASAASGIRAKAGRAQGILAGDLNQDGWTDLYVANDLNPNFLFINQKDGTFHEEAELVGVAYDRLGKVHAGMGLAAADTRNRGVFDLFVTNFELEHNAFYQHDEAGFYEDVSHLVGLAADSLPWIGWGTSFADFDLDGWFDLIVVNGHVDDNLREFGREGEYAQPAFVWRNNRGKFESQGASAGEYFAGAHPARGLAIADLDNDGDWDVVCGHQDEHPELLCNSRVQGTADPAGIQLTLIGLDCNREGVGTTVTIATKEATPLAAQVMGGGSYLSASERTLLIGTEGIATEPAITLRIRWPGRDEPTLAELPGPGRFIIIEPLRGQRTCQTLTEARMSAMTPGR